MTVTVAYTHAQNDANVILTSAAVWCEVIIADCTLSTPGTANARCAMTMSGHRMTTDVAGVCTVTWDATSGHTVIARLQRTSSLVL